MADKFFSWLIVGSNQNRNITNFWLPCKQWNALYENNYSENGATDDFGVFVQITECTMSTTTAQQIANNQSLRLLPNELFPLFNISVGAL